MACLGNTWDELGALAKLSLPSTLINSSDVAISLITILFLGYSDTDHLAVASIGIAYVNMIWYFVEGFLTAQDSLSHEAFIAVHNRGLNIEGTSMVQEYYRGGGSSRSRDMARSTRRSGADDDVADLEDVRFSDSRSMTTAAAASVVVGAGRGDEVSGGARGIRQWTYVSSLLFLPMGAACVILCLLSFIIIPHYLNVDAQLAAKASAYVVATIPSLLLLYICRVLQKHIQAFGIMRPSVLSGAVAAAVHLLVTYICVFPMGGGYMGAAAALCLTRAAALVVLLYHIIHHPHLDVSWYLFGREVTIIGTYQYIKRMHKSMSVRMQRLRHRLAPDSGMQRYFAAFGLSSNTSSSTSRSSRSTSGRGGRSGDRAVGSSDEEEEEEGVNNDGDGDNIADDDEAGVALIGLSSERSGGGNEISSSSSNNSSSTSTSSNRRRGRGPRGSEPNLSVSVSNPYPRDTSGSSRRGKRDTAIDTTATGSSSTTTASASGVKALAAFVGSSGPLVKDALRFVVLGLAGGVILGLEVWSFDAGTMLASYIGPVTLSAHTILLMWTIFLYVLMPFAVSIAASVRIHSLINARNAAGAQLTANTVLLLAFMVASINAGLTYGGKDVLGYLFSSDKYTRGRVAALAPTVALFQFFNALEACAQGVLRGCGRQGMVIALNILSLWVFGFPAGLILTFYARPSAGIYGIWYGFIMGVGMQAVVLLWLVWTFDWEREVRRARVRHGEDPLTLANASRSASGDDKDEEKEEAEGGAPTTTSARAASGLSVPRPGSRAVGSFLCHRLVSGEEMEEDLDDDDRIGITELYSPKKAPVALRPLV